MDVYGIEALLGLPEFRVVDQVIRPKQLELHLQRRATSIVCPRCQTCCSHVQDSRPRCLRDLPILERPVLLWLHLRRFACPECPHRPWEKSDTFGARVKWTARLYQQVRAEFLGGCPSRELARRYGLSERTVFRWTFERSRGGRPRQLGRAIGIDEYARRKGHHYNTSIIDLDTGLPSRRLRDGVLRMSSPGSSVARKPSSTALKSWYWICPRRTPRRLPSSLASRCR